MLFFNATCTGGVSYTVGGATVPPTSRFAPPTLCFATPTFERFGDFRALKRWFLTLAMQNCYICRHFDIQFLVFISKHSRTSSQFCPTNFPEKLHPWPHVAFFVFVLPASSGVQFSLPEGISVLGHMWRTGWSSWNFPFLAGTAFLFNLLYRLLAGYLHKCY